MNLDEHLMVIAAEECAETAHRISKALRFGMEQIQQDADDKPEENPEHLTNRERIRREYENLAAAMEMIGITTLDRARIDAKKLKVERYLQRSIQCGTLNPPSVAPEGEKMTPTPTERERDYTHGLPCEQWKCSDTDYCYRLGCCNAKFQRERDTLIAAAIPKRHKSIHIGAPACFALELAMLQVTRMSNLEEGHDVSAGGELPSVAPEGEKMITECCGRTIQADDRYCPRCGWECRVLPPSLVSPAPQDED